MIKKIICLGVLLFCLTTQISAVDARIVKKIELVGLKRVNSGRVRRLIRMRVDRPYSDYRASRDFSKIYDSNLFSNVELVSEPYEDGIKLVYHLTERPIVQDVEFAGNKKIKDAKIMSYIKGELDRKARIRKGRTLASWQLAYYQRAIKEFYKKEGYHLAEVSPQLKETEPGYVVVTFNITENKPIRIKWIEFFGNRAYRDWRLRWVISTTKYSFPIERGLFDREKYLEDLESLKEFYLKRGYLSMKITDDKVNIDSDRNRIYIEIFLEEGPQYRYGAATVKGNTLFSTEEILYWLNLKKGRKYKQKKVDEAIAFVKDKYGELGYISALVKIEPVLDIESGFADLKVFISEGRKAYIERIDFRNNDITKEKVLRREMLIKPLEVANTKKLRRSFEKLNRLGYFKELAPQVEPGSRKDLVNIVWQMKEQKTGRFRIGASYSNLDRLTGQMGLGIVNLFGYGQKLKLDLEAGSRLTQYSFSFIEPYLFDTRYYFGLNYQNSRREITGYENYSNSGNYVGYRYYQQGGSVKIGHPYFDYLWVFVTHGVRYGRYEKLAGLELPSDTIQGAPITRTMGLTVTWDDRNDLFFPTRGSYQSCSLTQAGGVFKGDNHFNKVSFDSRFYYGFWRERLALASRFSGDSVKEFAFSKSVPAEERFSLGGSDTVRGYPDFALGFRQRYRLFTNAEFRWKLNKMFQMVTFWDSGGIWDHQTDIKTADFYPGAGFGFRINMPMVGMVRVDYGMPLDPRWPLERSRGELHFSMGNTF